ncbi:phytanoyl-CoA dioxygenase family protein [Roseovarius aestuarii]|uniref:Phytanoyl-CoA dioxygenase (PhyH) n=1 Tax=Roseovarius aestuarii TaxID=475083 RepID=A0A1X7BKS8_9RHOB|nr:phytanoyl-CoA dioxygenase family protein [Roseovarius aestuarii]SMC10262.1 Phytanoyl-CoA dioxygenase (PhyH) [Roseovarius aestuarii]
MRPTDILSHPPRVLGQTEREFFFDQGYVVREKAISDDWLARLNAAIDAQVDRSRQLTASDGTFDLETGHSADNPRLRRISYLDDLDPVFWEFCTESNLADLAADLMGPDVRFRECMINIKWAGGGQEVRWHQDIPFYPLTNFSVAQFLVCLKDVGTEQGPLQVVPQSHKGPIYNHYDDADNWLGYIPDNRLADAGIDSAVDLTGPAGTVTVHHCATLHASRANLSQQGRPVLIVGFAACDALPYTAPAYRSTHYGTVVRGQEARFSHHEPVDMRLPPDWSGGYTSIFEHQQHKAAG